MKNEMKNLGLRSFLRKDLRYFMNFSRTPSLANFDFIAINVAGTITYNQFEDIYNQFLDLVKNENTNIRFLFKCRDTAHKMYTLSPLYTYDVSLKKGNAHLTLTSWRFETLQERYGFSCDHLCLVYYKTKSKNIIPTMEQEPVLRQSSNLTDSNSINKYLNIFPFYNSDPIQEKDLQEYPKTKLLKIEYPSRNENQQLNSHFDLKKNEDFQIQDKAYTIINNDIEYLISEIITSSCIKRSVINSSCHFYIPKDSSLKPYYIEYSKSLNIPKKAQKLTKKLKIITADIETLKLEDGSLMPYAIGYYTGETIKKYFLTDFNQDAQEMIYTMFKSILISKYHTYTIYFHNFGKFDAFFIVNTLRNKFQNSIKIIENNKQLISIKIIYGNKNYYIKFFDSYLLLPLSLRKLANTFNVETKKGNFPHKFVKKENLNYFGILPEYKYYSELSYEEYLNLDQNNWSLKESSLEYLESDLLSLYQVLEYFNNYIYENFKLNITEFLTLPSLSFGIFKSSFYKGNLVQIVDAKYNDIKSSYHGGRCEVLIPQFNNKLLRQPNQYPSKEKLYCYDVNSLYPFSMLNPLPVGNIGISNNTNLDSIFGFCYAKIKTPDNIFFPVLPYKLDNKLYFPKGEFEGWYFSEELKYAKNKGYTINIEKSLIMDSDILFDKYVNFFYKLKNSSKDGEKIIGKFFLNSLYGKFGMEEKDEFIEIIDESNFEKYEALYDITDLTKLDNDQLVIHYKDTTHTINDSIVKDEKKFPLNISIAVSAAIASYSRIYMHKIITDMLDKKAKVYYTDTDSIILNKPLPNELVGSKIGQFKLVHDNIVEAYFPTSKIYALVLDTGEEVLKFSGLNKGSYTIQHIKALLEKETIKIVNKRQVKDLYSSLYQEKEIEMNISSNYDKRIKLYKKPKFVEKGVDKNKQQWYTTEPIILNPISTPIKGKK